MDDVLFETLLTFTIAKTLHSNKPALINFKIGKCCELALDMI